MSRIWNKRIIRLASIGAGLVLLWVVVMAVMSPRDIMSAEPSTIIRSAHGELLGARIAPDGQWRFPASDTVSARFAAAIVEYEDNCFWWHPGVNPFAIAESVIDNIRAGRVVRGGSTITMQLARMSLGDRPRTVANKLLETNLALYLELTHTKEHLLAMYASLAPFGGNTVGLETAAWRYFSRPASNLSWAETATLAVLPNSPALIHPGRRRDDLKRKRDALLRRLYDKGLFDEETLALAISEPLPDAPHPLPDDAPHLLSSLLRSRHGTIIESTLDANLQRRVQFIVNDAARRYSEADHVNNAAVLVAEVATGKVLAYVGNASFAAPASSCNQVDVIRAKRSTGSTLKPILYAAMLHDGSIMPSSLVPDTPFQLKGFSPQNFNRGYSGAVHADEAIRRSLNVPLARMIREYRVARMLELLRRLGITTLTNNEDYYGISLILGGGEATLWEMCGMYGSLARTLTHYRSYMGKYDERDIHPLNAVADESIDMGDPIIRYDDARLSESNVLDYGALWYMTEAMSGLNRPEEESDWSRFGSMKRVAWKTGTSYGGKDGWAIGFNHDYVVGVWVGNATGLGRPGLTGVGHAAPVMFNVFSLLPSSPWFDEPYDCLEETLVCHESGYKASTICPHIDTMLVPRACVNSAPCPFHHMVHLSADRSCRVDGDCYPPSLMVSEPWFVLPPTQEYYFCKVNLDYCKLPPLMPGCGSDDNPIGVIYPERNSIIVLPKGFDGKQQKVVLRAAHRDQNGVLYWHLDEQFIGTTDVVHEMAVAPDKGRHTLTVVDQSGNSVSISFDVM